MRPQRMKEFEFRLGKLGLVLFVIGISFLLFLSFVTGVMVGVNMEGNPDQISQGIPGILKQKVARSQPGGSGRGGKRRRPGRQKGGSRRQGRLQTDLLRHPFEGKGGRFGRRDAAQGEERREQAGGKSD